jgi:LAO/AO transport system kinase
MEMADMILINKADGDLKPAATRTCADYAGALRLLRKRRQDPEGYPRAMMVSALAEEGLEAAWADMRALVDWRRAHGFFEATRAAQARYWFEEEVRQALLAQLAQADVRAAMDALAERVATGALTPVAAAQELVRTRLHR